MVEKSSNPAQHGNLRQNEDYNSLKVHKEEAQR